MLNKTLIPEGKVQIHQLFIKVLFLYFCLHTQAAIADNWKDSQITALKQRATASVQNIDGITGNLGSLNRLQDFVTLVQESRQSLNNDVLDFLQQGREEIESALAEQSQGMDEFLGGNNCGAGSPCDQFKQNIGDLFRNLRLMSQTLFQLHPASPADLSVDLEIFSNLVESAPGRAIYPLYVGMTSGSNLFQSDLSGYFDLVLEGLEILKIGILMDVGTGELHTVSTAFVVPTVDIPDRCPVIMETITPDRFQAAQRILFGFSILSKAVAKILIAKGETGFSGMQLGIHGYIGGNLSNNRKKKIGLVVEGVSDSIGLIATHANNMLRYCTIVNNQAQIVDAVLKNQFPGNGPKSSR